MKYFCLFFAMLYLLAQTCYGYGTDLNQLHIVFINNVVDPNENQVETLSNVAAYPYIQGTNSSLMTRYGVVVNYTMIFSVEPDHIITLRGLDMDHYSMSYFRNVVRNFTTYSCRGASLQAVSRALEITSSPSFIFMAVNRRPKGISLMMEILEKMSEKMNPIFIFHIEEDGSISNFYFADFDIDLDRFVPADFKRNSKQLAPEYSAIMEVTKELVFILVFEGVMKDMSAVKASTVLPIFNKISKRFGSSGKRSVVFVYDVVNATEQDLDQISRSMESYYQSRNGTYRITYQYFAIFSSNPDTVIDIDMSLNHTAQDFKTMIKTQTKYGYNKPTLKSLHKALQIIPPFSWISYYVKDVPDVDDNNIFIEILKLIQDKCIDIKIHGYGNLTNTEPLPVLYRTMKEASRMASSSPQLTLSFAYALVFYHYFVTDNKIRIRH